MNNEVVKRIGEHDHAGNGAGMEVTKVMNVMKKAKSTQNIPHKLNEPCWIQFYWLI